MAELHETMMGKKLITNDIPRLITNVEKLGNTLEKINDILNDMHTLFLQFKEKENGTRNTRDL